MDGDKQWSEASLKKSLEGFAINYWVNTVLSHGFDKIMEALDLVLSVLKVGDMFHQL